MIFDPIVAPRLMLRAQITDMIGGEPGSPKLELTYFW